MSALSFALCFLALALALACGFCNASSDAGLQDNQTMDITKKTVISLTDALPLPAKWVLFDCDVAGRFELGHSGNHQWAVPSEKQVDSCNATWGHSSASFAAYDANYDEGHLTVYWSFKLDGFFHSWDNYTWEKRASWEH